MKTCLIFASLFLQFACFADSLPVITSQPQNLTGSGTFMVVATGATGYQWRHAGIDILNATNATLSATDPGYYDVIVKNAAGWVPSQMAYLFVSNGNGIVPFSNYSIPQTFQTQVKYITGGPYGSPVTNGLAQIVAGPELDEMQPLSEQWDFSWFGNSFAGYFDDDDQPVPTVAPGQAAYYRVQVGYPTTSYVQISTTLKLTAGGGTNPTPSAAGLKFPGWPEWPEPYIYSFPSATKQKVAGETVSFALEYEGYTDFGIPTNVWRKDGMVLTNATNWVGHFIGVGMLGSEDVITTLTITNLQPSDAGVYDAIIYGNNWLVTPKFTLSVVLNGQGVFQNSRSDGMNFIADLVSGATNRNYMIEWSTNLTLWNGLLTLTNTSGTMTFSNAMSSDGGLYYRSRLLP